MGAGILKPGVKRKLMKWCIERGYNEEVCRDAVEKLDALVEEEVRKALEEILAK